MNENSNINQMNVTGAESVNTQAVNNNGINVKKGKNCPNCGNVVSKSASSCPQCGHKLKKKGKKVAIGCTTPLLIIALLVGILVFSARPKAGTIGETYKQNELEFTVESISFYRGAKTGVYEVDNSPCIAIEGVFENISKNQKTVSGDDFSVDFDDGYVFSSKYLYLESSSYIDVSGNEQETFKLYEGGVLLTPLESGAQEFKMLIPVADTVFESGDKPIEIKVFNYIYKFDSVSSIKNSREDTIDRLSDALSD